MVDTLVLEGLAANRARRERAEAELSAARRELVALLGRGYADNVKVAPMARAAGISRQTAHKLLGEGGDGA